VQADSRVAAVEMTTSRQAGRSLVSRDVHLFSSFSVRGVSGIRTVVTVEK
jgi:hypothetical protein